jgi:Flp pilus assembly pilin Flp
MTPGFLFNHEEREMNVSIEQLAGSGLIGCALALVILVLVYAAKYTKLVKGGNAARLLNVALAMLVSGVAANPSSLENQIIAVTGMLVSAGMHELLSYLAKQFPVDGRNAQGSGQGMVEYAFILVLAALAVIAALMNIGSLVAIVFSIINTSL